MFWFRFFSWIIFPQIATSIKDTGGKFATGVNGTGGKQWEQYQTADNLSELEGKNLSIANSTT